jgi:hypothetical protein
MKLILSAFFLMLAVVLTAGLYLSIRKTQNRKADIGKLYGLFSKVAQRNRQLINHLFRTPRSGPDVANSSTAEEANGATT